MVIPATALFRLHDKDWVFFPLGGKRFRRSEVQAGAMNGDGTQQIVSGLEPGESVVADALQLSAAARAENPIVFQDQEQKAQP